MTRSFLVIEDLDEEFSWLDAAERWDRFLAPLIEALDRERLGKVLDIDSLIEDRDGQRIVMAQEIQIEVSDAVKAAELVRRIERQAKRSKGME